VNYLHNQHGNIYPEKMRSASALIFAFGDQALRFLEYVRSR
jgi:hypothetical protein